MLAYIWNDKGIFPSDVLSKPLFERRFLYEATIRKIDAEDKAMKKGKKK